MPVDFGRGASFAVPDAACLICVSVRPCAMVVPDFELICEIMLVAEGFLEARLLARKFITLYSLCKELLSKQVGLCLCMCLFSHQYPFRLSVFSDFLL